MSDELDEKAEAFFASFDRPILRVRQPVAPLIGVLDSTGVDDVAEAFILFARAYAAHPEWSRWRVERAILEGQAIGKGDGLLTLIDKVIEVSREQKDRGRLRSAMLLFLAASGLSTKAKEML